MTVTSLIKLSSDSGTQALSSADTPHDTDSETSIDLESAHSCHSTDASGRLSGEQEPLKDYYEEMVNVVDELFEVSILIRSTSRNFRTSRAAAYVETDDEGNDVLEKFGDIVALKIKWRYPKTEEWLLLRLVNVIVMRRQQFLYQKAHKQKMATISSTFRDESTSRSAFKKALSRPTFDAGKHEVNVTTDDISATPRTTRTGTSMKTLDTVASDLLPQDETSKFQIQFAPSERRLGDITFPGPPKRLQGRFFECNQCFHILPDETRDEVPWRFFTYILFLANSIKGPSPVRPSPVFVHIVFM